MFYDQYNKQILEMRAVAWCIAGLFLLLILLFFYLFIRKMLIKRKACSGNNNSKGQTITLTTDFTYSTDIEEQTAPLVCKSSATSTPSYNSPVLDARPKSAVLTQQSSLAYSLNSIPRSMSLEFMSDEDRQPKPGFQRDSLIRKSSSSVTTDSLDLSMYESSSDVSSTGGGQTLGFLCFRLYYDRAENRLIVTVLKALELYIREGSLNPFVKLCLSPDNKRKFQTKTKRGDAPEFNQEFYFNLKSEELELVGEDGDQLNTKQELKFTVCHFDRFSRQHKIGYVIVPLSQYPEVLTEDGTGDIWKEISDIDAPVGTLRGELLISLCHLPTAERVNLTVLKAKDLLVKEEKETAISIKINMILNRKSMKSRKTNTRRDIIIPVFNEAFVFDIPANLIDQTSFALSVYAHRKSSSLSSKKSKDKRRLGGVIIGSSSFASEVDSEHWNDMMTQPRYTVTSWHALK